MRRVQKSKRLRSCLKLVQAFSKNLVQITGLIHSLDLVQIQPVHKLTVYTTIRNVMNGFAQLIYTGLNSLPNQLTGRLYPSSTTLTAATAVYKIHKGG
jgi:hypothetical protein